MSSVLRAPEAEAGLEVGNRGIQISPAERTRRLLLAGSAVWLVGASFSVWRCTVDDAYITFRYAQNIASGLGPVFNVGQRVEGYTDVLWILLLAAGTRLTSDPILTSKVLGLTFQLSALLAGYFLARLLATKTLPMRGFALLLTASNTYFIVYSVTDMETPLFTSLLCWGLVAYLKAFRESTPERQSRSFGVASLLFALLALTRPDGVLTYCLLWCHTAWKFRERPRNIIFFSVPIILLYAPYFCWRWHYYGLFFPNTFYAKLGGTLALLVRGAKQAARFFALQSGGWFLAGSLGIAVLVFPAEETTALALAIASRVLFNLWSGGVTMGEFRFLISVLPLIWLLAERLLTGAMGAWGTETRSFRALAGTCGLLVLAQFAAFLQVRTKNVIPVEAGMERAHIALGKWLSTHSSPTDTIAVGDIGAIGYWSHANILDLDGLTDTHISHLPGALSEKKDAPYVLRQAPDFIVLRTSKCSPELADVSFETDKAVFADVDFKRNYHSQDCWEFWPQLDLVLYRRDFSH